MDALIAQAIKLTTALRKTSVAWKPDEPHAQPYYAFDTATSSWVPKTPSPDAVAAHGITHLAIYTWNIDFMLPHAEPRMRAALAHLDTLTSTHANTTTAAVIFLQECTPGDLATIAAAPWVRARHHLTDVDASNWATAHYGTVALVDARLTPAAAFRVHYAQTRMDRDALFVDVVLSSSSSSLSSSSPSSSTDHDGGKSTTTGRRKVVRLCNTHLESLALDPPFRPPQMRLVARHLRAEGVHAGLAAGDFNAVQPADRTLHSEGGNGLRDAYLELGGQEDAEAGYTWGQQAATALRAQFGCSRMDKVYLCGGARPVRLERFGAEVLVEGEEEGREIVGLGFERPWITDHLGVMAEVEIVP